MSAKLRRALYEDIAQTLARLEPTFSAGYKLTFVARHTTNPNAHVIVTGEADGTEGFDALRTALADLERNGIPVGECHSQGKEK
jgi:hypothetical protein